MSALAVDLPRPMGTLPLKGAMSESSTESKIKSCNCSLSMVWGMLAGSMGRGKGMRPATGQFTDQESVL